MEMYLRREFFRTIQFFNSFTSYWCCKLFCISTDMQSQNNDSILDVTMEGYLLKHIWKKSMLNFFSFICCESIKGTFNFSREFSKITRYYTFLDFIKMMGFKYIVFFPNFHKMYGSSCNANNKNLKKNFQKARINESNKYYRYY